MKLNDRIEALGRQAQVHSRLLDSYRKVQAKDARREFRRALAKATGRTEESVCRWLGHRQEHTSPWPDALDAIEGFLKGRS